jgi:hypothetical protein
VLVVLGFTAPASASNGAFVAPMSGAQEVEPVDTNARGLAVFHLSKDGTELSFRVNVANIENVTMAHIHVGERGVNGPPVVWLYPSGPPPVEIPGRTNGTLATGTITADDLVGPLEGQTMDDLVDEIHAGNTYVNVHTTEFEDGEVRGQIETPGR